MKTTCLGDLTLALYERFCLRYRDPELATVATEVTLSEALLRMAATSARKRPAKRVATRLTPQRQAALAVGA